jgi:cell division protein FtsL
MLETLSSHRLLDRLIRGRLWIGIVAFALIGIVTLQLGLLKLNSGIGRALEKESLLQRENAALSIENSELAGGNRVESEAGRLGMRLTGVGGLVFHDSHARSDVPHAAAGLQEAPKPAETSSEATSAGSSEGEGEAEAGTPTPAASGESGAGSESSGGVSSESGGESTSEASPESSSSAAGGESGEAPAPAAAATGESSGAGGGTAAPGG